MIVFDDAKYNNAVIAFTPNDIIYKDQFINAYIKTNDVWRIGYPSDWSFEHQDNYYKYIKNSYDWQLIYETYSNYEKAIKYQPERLNGETPDEGDAKV